MRSYTRIATVDLLNTIFTLIKSIYHTYHVLERTKTCHANFKKNCKEKNANTLKPSRWISLNINAITIGAVEWKRCISLRYIAHKILIYFYNLIKLVSKLLKNLVAWLPREAIQDNLPEAFIKTENNKCRVILDCAEVFIERPKPLDCQAAT